MLERVTVERTVAEKGAARAIILNKLRELVAGKQGVDALMGPLKEFSEMKLDFDYQVQEQQKVNEMRQELFSIFKARDKKGFSKEELDKLYGIMLALTEYWPANYYKEGEYVDSEGEPFSRIKPEGNEIVLSLMDREENKPVLIQPTYLFSDRILTGAEIEKMYGEGGSDIDDLFDQEKEYLNAAFQKSEAKSYDLPEPPRLHLLQLPEEVFFYTRWNTRDTLQYVRKMAVNGSRIFLAGLVLSVGVPVGLFLEVGVIATLSVLLGMLGGGLLIVGSVMLTIGLIIGVFGTPLSAGFGYLMDKYESNETFFSQEQHSNLYKWGFGIGSLLGVVVAIVILSILWPYIALIVPAASSVITVPALTATASVAANTFAFFGAIASYSLSLSTGFASMLSVVMVGALGLSICSGAGLYLGIKAGEAKINRSIKQQYERDLAQYQERIIAGPPVEPAQGLSGGHKIYNEIVQEIEIQVTPQGAEFLRKMRSQSQSQSQSSQPIEAPPDYDKVMGGRSRSNSTTLFNPPSGASMTSDDAKQNPQDKSKPGSGSDKPKRPH